MFYRFAAILHSKYTGRDVLAESVSALPAGRMETERSAA
jgi:hypothetical protein